MRSVGRMPGLGALLALAIVGISGCSDEQWVPTINEAAYPVKGRILLPSGKPLPGGRVEFIPAREPGLLAYGQVAPDGTFALQTRGPGDGAVPGEYKVKILIPERQEFRRLARYRDEDSSQLKVTVRAEPNDLAPIRLK